MASATTSATQEPISSAANQTGEEDIQTGDIDLLDFATRKLTTPGVQSNPDEAIEKSKTAIQINCKGNNLSTDLNWIRQKSEVIQVLECI